ncbi:MAG: flagellar hook-length control protein FliK [Deltaproteobacteria bacterium]|nr:flagellar hook-length control protein FliK [Deltaproteobacteria bacterium]
MKTSLARNPPPPGPEALGAGAPTEPRAGVCTGFGRFDDHLARARRREPTPTRADDRDDGRGAAVLRPHTAEDAPHGDRGRVAPDDAAADRDDGEPRRPGLRDDAERDDERDASSSTTAELRTPEALAPVPATLDVTAATLDVTPATLDVTAATLDITAATLDAGSPDVLEGDRHASMGVGDSVATRAAIASSPPDAIHGPRPATATTMAPDDAATGAATPTADAATVTNRATSGWEPAAASREGDGAPASDVAASDAAPPSYAAAGDPPPAEPTAAPAPTAIAPPAAPGLPEPAATRPASATPSTDDTAVLTIERAEDLAEAVDRLRPLPKGGATISVQTPALGRVALHVALDDGALRIRVVADDPAALEWFRGEHDGLLAAARQAVPAAEHVELELRTRHDGAADAMPQRDTGQRDTNHHGRSDREVFATVHGTTAAPQRSKGAPLKPSASARRGGALVDVVA